MTLLLLLLLWSASCNYLNDPLQQLAGHVWALKQSNHSKFPGSHLPGPCSSMEAVQRLHAGDFFAWFLNVSTSVIIVFANKVLLDPKNGHAFAFGK